ncbi:endonuclease/exonuclease/phosphatase [Cryomyces antarcticus]
MKTAEPLPIRLITHNIRYATTNPFEGEERWDIRKPRLLAELRFHTLYSPAAFICLQEALHAQLLDILSGLNSPPNALLSASGVSEWAYTGVGRDDGDQLGEYSPIIYRPSVWSICYSNTIWLSETPGIPGSKSWDAASPRILTIGIFKHRQSGHCVAAMNTHLDDQGVISRLHAATTIVSEIERLLKGRYSPSSVPVLLAGDFNSESDGEAYRLLSASSSPVQDMRDLTTAEQRYGDQNTYTGFGCEGERRTRIDFLFLDREKQGQDEGMNPPRWCVKGYAVLENQFEDGVFCSDHRAVIGDVELNW